MTTKEAAKKYGVSVGTLLANAKTAGVLPKRVVRTGKRGRPSFLWTDNQAQAAVGK